MDKMLVIGNSLESWNVNSEDSYDFFWTCSCSHISLQCALLKSSNAAEQKKWDVLTDFYISVTVLKSNSNSNFY